MDKDAVFVIESPAEAFSPVLQGGAEKEVEEENPFIAVNGVKTVTLYKPITIDGRELKEVTLDFNKLTAADLDNVEAEMNASGGAKSPVPAMSSSFNLRVAARAAGVNYHDLQRLNVKDAAKLSLIAQNFLLG